MLGCSVELRWREGHDKGGSWVLQFLRITAGGTAWVDVPQAKEAEKVMSLEDKFFIYGQIGSVMAAKLAKIASEHYAKP